MKTIRMTQTALGAEDRVTVKTYTAGETYTLDDELANMWLRSGTAELVEPPKPAPAPAPRRRTRKPSTAP